VWSSALSLSVSRVCSVFFFFFFLKFFDTHSEKFFACVCAFDDRALSTVSSLTSFRVFCWVLSLTVSLSLRAAASLRNKLSLSLSSLFFFFFFFFSPSFLRGEIINFARAFTHHIADRERETHTQRERKGREPFFHSSLRARFTRASFFFY